MIRFLLWNLFGLSLLAVGWQEGYVLPVLQADQTYLTWVIAGLGFIGIVICGWKFLGLRELAIGLGTHSRNDDRRAAAFSAHISLVRVLGNLLLRLGLIGTIIGLMIAANEIDPATAGGIDAVGELVAALLAGLGTALPTTLVGAIGSAWLLFCYHMLQYAATREFVRCT